jgi:hypothetical protein
MRAKTYFIFILLIVMAFAVGYVLGYWKFYDAEKEWAAAKTELQSTLSTLKKQLAQAKARETLREMSDAFTEILGHLTEKNFGLAAKAADGMKEKFLGLQPGLDETLKAQFNFLVPGLEEIRKESEAVSPNAKKKVEELKMQFDQVLKPAKQG